MVDYVCRQHLCRQNKRDRRDRSAYELSTVDVPPCV